MTEVQITRWRDIPSMVAARDGADVCKVSLEQRFQEAIDEAAMRVGAADADAYMAGWQRSDWEPAAGTPTEAAERTAAELTEEWSQEALAAFLDGLGAQT